MAPRLQKLHHVAYRCNDAGETVEFYTKILGMPFAHALTNDYVPSNNSYSPHIHIFFEMADGSYIAFFEVPKSPPQQKDANTPEWVQHLALEIGDEAALLNAKRSLDEAGVANIGPIDHHIAKSIYLFDPSGHRLELTARTEKPGEVEKHRSEAYGVLKAWQARAIAEKWPARRFNNNQN